MPLSHETCQAFTKILNAELMVAMGCTEPIAIAYCAACARDLLGLEPERCVVRCSGNIIKNVKAVVVPQTGGLKGIRAAAAAGIVAACPEAKLEVLTRLTEDDRGRLRDILENVPIEVEPLDSGHSLHIIVDLFAGKEDVSVEILDNHTNLGRVLRNGQLIQDRRAVETSERKRDYALLNLRDILEYAATVDLGEIRDALERQIDYNSAISDEGLKNVYGAGIGPVLMKHSGNSLRERAKASAAAASDARMNGCALPVIINSGSGNQGITVSLPVILYAEDNHLDREALLRALSAANLTAIYQKVGIGALSAYCGATCAAIGAMVGIACLDGADYDVIAQTITNGVATIGGMVCDGAKSSCAGKIAAALDSAFTAYETAKLHRGYREGEGIVKDSVEETLQSVSRMASVGMHDTDMEILKIMLDK